MRFWSRRSASQRKSKERQLVFVPNWGGQGGSANIALHDKVEDVYYILEPTTIEEARELLSQAHICYANMEEPR